MGDPWHLLRSFSSFQTNFSIFYDKICEKKCPYFVLGFEPTTCKSSPITTRPGLPSCVQVLVTHNLGL